MTPEKTLERITAVINALPHEESEMAHKLINANDRINFTTPWSLLAAMVLDLREEIAANEAKGAGKHSIRNAALRVLKNGDSNRPMTKYAYTDPDGIQWLCDGFRMLRFTEPIALPEKPKDLTPFDYQRVWKHKAEDLIMESALPAPADLRAFIKTFKAENKGRMVRGKRARAEFHFGEEYPVYDAEYLLDCIEAVPDAKVAKINRMKSLYIFGEKTAVLLMPIARPEHEHAPRTC